MKTVQQFYNEGRYIDIAGSQYSEEAKRYDPKKVQECEIDITVSDGYNTPAYQMIANNFLLELFRANAVDVRTMLENSSFPFATRILESLKRNEQQLMQGTQMEGIPPEVLRQTTNTPISGYPTNGNVATSAIPAQENTAQTGALQ